MEINMKTCPNCGALVGDHFDTCNACGRAFPPELKLDKGEFVAPPEFPEDVPDNEGIHLTLDPDEGSPSAPAPENNVPSGEASENNTTSEEAPENNTSSGEAPASDHPADTFKPEFEEPPVYPDPPSFEDTPASDNAGAGNVPPASDNARAGNVPPQNEGPKQETSSGERINLTQEAINRQKERKSSSYSQTGGYSSYSYSEKSSYTGSSGQPVTGTAGMVLGIVGLALVVIFGAIGSCSGVRASSFILTLIGLAACIVGLVLSKRDRTETGGTCERANIGYVLSIIGIVLGAVLLIIGISCVGCIGCIACSAANSLLP